MFNHSAGFHIFNSNFYDVGGDLNLHPIQGRRSAGQSPADLALKAAGSEQSLPIQAHEMRDAVFQPPRSMVGTDSQAEGCRCEFAGAVRNTPHGNAVRKTPYAIPSSLTVANAGSSMSDARSATYPDVGPSSSVHRGTFITAANVDIYGPKRRREEEIDEKSFYFVTPVTLLTRVHFTDESFLARRRKDGVKIIRSRHIKLLGEIGSGPGYFLHAAQNKGRPVIVRVFNRSPTVRQQMETTVALSKGLMHPNILRMKGTSSAASLVHFIAYENAHWKNAEGPLAFALKNDRDRSITLGFKMIAGLSAGMNHLCVQGVSVGCLGVENLDVFLDVDDRFLISINPRRPEESDKVESPESQEDESWRVFTADNSTEGASDFFSVLLEISG
ncbi:hypothetical protein B0H19DRAFT_1260766 [Mycena capillaripes]|nr:hypothetical protein B0H19DRAFT_1260766 [Mycena capillaripes]